MSELYDDDGAEEAKGADCAVDHEEILEALKDRQDWDGKQELWQKMRHEGVGRASKPWPKAADMHFPLADMQIEKLKPFYTQQIYNSELIAAFTAAKPEAAAHANAAAGWFDYQIRQRSNFEDIRPILIDRMCERGRAVVRVMWDAKRKRLRYEVPRPQDIIVPAATGELKDADWIVLVQTWSVHAYKRAGVFKTDDGILDRIKGSGMHDQRQLREDEYRRAGITHGATKNEIVVWVVHEREGDRWRIRTYSPNEPKTALREDFLLPYTHGMFAEAHPPFAPFGFEKKEELFLGPRGVCEKVAPFEQSLNGDWNTMKDHQKLCSSPVFYRKDGVKNSANVRFRPGDILPYEILKVDFPDLPNDLRQGMIETRQVAEQLVGAPDVGIGGVKNPGGNKTATEVAAIGNIAGMGAEERARLFRREFATLLRLSWSILCQYAKEERQYLFNDKFEDVAKEALKPEDYTIEPSASGDSFTREQKAAKAANRFGMFKGDPYIKQDELRKDVLESDTPGLVRRLFTSPEAVAANQMEDQSTELCSMLIGFQSAVTEADDHATHLQSIEGFLTNRSMMRNPVPPEAMMLIAQHASEHHAALKLKDKAASGQFDELLASLTRLAQAAAQALQQQAAAMQAQQPQQPQPGAPTAQPQPAPVA